MTARWSHWFVVHVLVPLGWLIAAIVNKLRKPKPAASAAGVGVLWPDLQQKPLPAPPPSLSLTGVYMMCMMSSTVTPDQVALPEGVEFDSSCQGPDGKYFAAVGFGYQMGVRPAWLPASLGYNYLEIVSGVAGVRIKGQPERGSFSSMGRLLLNDRLATILGKLIGLPKKMTPQLHDQGIYQGGLLSNVTCAVQGEGFVGVEFQMLPDAPVIAPADPAFDAYRKFLELPVLSRNAFGQLIDLDFEFQFDQAIVQPISVNLFVQMAGYPGMPPGQWSWTGLDAAHPQAACRIWVPWVMQLNHRNQPVPASRVPPPGPFPIAGHAPFKLFPPVNPQKPGAAAAAAAEAPSGGVGKASSAEKAP